MDIASDPLALDSTDDTGDGSEIIFLSNASDRTVQKSQPDDKQYAHSDQPLIEDECGELTSQRKLPNTNVELIEESLDIPDNDHNLDTKHRKKHKQSDKGGSKKSVTKGNSKLVSKSSSQKNLDHATSNQYQANIDSELANSDTTPTAEEIEVKMKLLMPSVTSQKENKKIPGKSSTLPCAIIKDIEQEYLFDDLNMPQDPLALDSTDDCSRESETPSSSNLPDENGPRFEKRKEPCANTAENQEIQKKSSTSVEDALNVSSDERVESCQNESGVDPKRERRYSAVKANKKLLTKLSSKLIKNGSKKVKANSNITNNQCQSNVNAGSAKEDSLPITKKSKVKMKPSISSMLSQNQKKKVSKKSSDISSYVTEGDPEKMASTAKEIQKKNLVRSTDKGKQTDKKDGKGVNKLNVTASSKIYSKFSNLRNKMQISPKKLRRKLPMTEKDANKSSNQSKTGTNELKSESSNHSLYDSSSPLLNKESGNQKVEKTTAQIKVSHKPQEMKKAIKEKKSSSIGRNNRKSVDLFGNSSVSTEKKITHEVKAKGSMEPDKLPIQKKLSSVQQDSQKVESSLYSQKEKNEEMKEIESTVEKSMKGGKSSKPPKHMNLTKPCSVFIGSRCSEISKRTSKAQDPDSCEGELVKSVDASEISSKSTTKSIAQNCLEDVGLKENISTSSEIIGSSVHNLQKDPQEPTQSSLNRKSNAPMKSCSVISSSTGLQNDTRKCNLPVSSDAGDLIDSTICEQATKPIDLNPPKGKNRVKIPSRKKIRSREGKASSFAHQDKKSDTGSQSPVSEDSAKISSTNSTVISPTMTKADLRPKGSKIIKKLKKKQPISLPSPPMTGKSTYKKDSCESETLKPVCVKDTIEIDPEISASDSNHEPDTTGLPEACVIPKNIKSTEYSDENSLQKGCPNLEKDPLPAGKREDTKNTKSCDSEATLSELQRPESTDSFPPTQRKVSSKLETPELKENKNELNAEDGEGDSQNLDKRKIQSGLALEAKENLNLNKKCSELINSDTLDLLKDPTTESVATCSEINKDGKEKDSNVNNGNMIVKKPVRIRNPKERRCDDNIQERCCNHWFPNHRAYLNHLTKFSDDTEKTHLQKLKDLQMKKCKNCSKWIEKSTYVRHMKKSHKIIVKFKASLKKSNLGSVPEKTRSSSIDEETLIHCFLGGRKVLKVSSVLDLPFHMKPILLVDRVPFIEKLIKDKIFSCQSWKEEHENPLLQSNIEFEPVSNVSSDFEEELLISELDLGTEKMQKKKVPSKTPKLKPKSKMGSVSETSTPNLKKNSKKKKSDAVVPSMTKKKIRVLNKSGFYDDFNSEGESDDIVSDSDYSAESDTENIEERDNVPTVELDLFTLDSAQEDMSVYLRDPHNPDFKVYANYNAIFVGDSALEDVTNQAGYVTDNNNVVYVSPGHFLFPEFEEAKPKKKNSKAKSIAEAMKKSISPGSKVIHQVKKKKLSPLKISKNNKKSCKQDKENSHVDESVSNIFDDSLLQDELSNFNDWVSTDEKPMPKSKKKCKQQSPTKQKTPYVFHLDSSEVEVIPLPSFDDTSEKQQPKRDFESYELDGEKVLVISTTMRPKGGLWPLKKKRKSRRVPICTIIGSSQKDADLLKKKTEDSFVRNFVVKEDQRLSPVPPALPPDLDIDRTSLFFDEHLPLNPSDIFPSEFSLDSLLKECDMEENEMPVANSSLISSATLTNTPIKGGQCLEDALEKGEQGLAYIDSSGLLRSPSGRIIEENTEPVVDDWTAIANAVESYAHTLPPVDPEPPRIPTKSPLKNKTDDPLKNLSLWDTPLMVSDRKGSSSPKKICKSSPFAKMSLTSKKHPLESISRMPVARPKLKIPKPKLKIPKKKDSPAIVKERSDNLSKNQQLMDELVNRNPETLERRASEKSKSPTKHTKEKPKKRDDGDSTSGASPVKTSAIKSPKKRAAPDDSQAPLSLISPKKQKLKKSKMDSSDVELSKTMPSLTSNDDVLSPVVMKKKSPKKRPPAPILQSPGQDTIAKEMKSVESPTKSKKKNAMKTSLLSSSNSSNENPEGTGTTENLSTPVKQKRKYTKKNQTPPSSHGSLSPLSTKPLPLDVSSCGILPPNQSSPCKLGQQVEGSDICKSKRKYVRKSQQLSHDELTLSETVVNPSNKIVKPKNPEVTSGDITKSKRKLSKKSQLFENDFGMQENSENTPKEPKSIQARQSQKLLDEFGGSHTQSEKTESSPSSARAIEPRTKKEKRISKSPVKRTEKIQVDALNGVPVIPDKQMNSEAVPESNITPIKKRKSTKRKRSDANEDQPASKKSKKTALDDIWNDVFTSDFQFSKEFIGFNDEPETSETKPSHPDVSMEDTSSADLPSMNSSSTEEFLGFDKLSQDSNAIGSCVENIAEIFADKTPSNSPHIRPIVSKVKEFTSPVDSIVKPNPPPRESAKKTPSSETEKLIKKKVLFSLALKPSYKTKPKHKKNKSKSPCNMRDIRSYFSPIQMPVPVVEAQTSIPSSPGELSPKNKLPRKILPPDYWKIQLKHSLDDSKYLDNSVVDCDFEGFFCHNVDDPNEHLEMLMTFVDALKMQYMFDTTDQTACTDELYDFDEDFVNSQL